MILESLHFALAYAGSKRRRRSEIAASISLWSRARRCARDWKPHEECCKAFIAEKCDRLSEARTAVVLGSGLLREAPIERLAKQFQRVELYDLVHLPSVRRQVRQAKLTNVTFIEHDLSDGIDFLREKPDVDLVISVNLVSQMALDFNGDAARLVTNHFASLLSGNWTPCLITDTGYSVIGRDGQVLTSASLLRGVDPPPAFRAWDWTVAPFGELSKETETVHHVIAV
jgi:hypothetical protein